MTKKKNKVMDIYFQSQSAYTIRREEYQGKQHIVVPVVMMVEGVHSGSHGPILHLAEELGRYPESWDGIPVTIGHPLVNGTYVSANSPDVLQDWAVGRIFNTQMTASALTAEAWLEEESLERISEDTLLRLNNGEIIEVSIGVFSDEEMAPGIWNNERYTAIARNHRPNHLAILPDQVGACSIVDGCGIRVNKKGETKVTKAIINNENQSQVLKELNLVGFSVNELGYSEIRERIAQSIYGLDGNGLDHYVEEIYEDYFVYTQYNHRVTPASKKLYKQSYSIDGANDVQLSGDPTQVKKEVSYTAIPNNNVRVKTERIIQKNNKSMCTDCVKRLADSLIANKDTAWSENDREYLESQTEEQLEKMTPPQPKQQVNTAKLNREDLLALFSEKPMTNEEFLSMASPEVRSQIEEGLQLRTNQKNHFVTEILANSDEWTEDELNGKELVELQKIHKVVTKDSGETVYAGSGNIGGKTKVVNTNQRKPKTTAMLPRGFKGKEN